MLRTIKVRSNENAIFQPNYNRMRFIVNADDMSTNLAESYLAFKLYVVNGRTGFPYTKDEIRNLNKSSIMFSFGDSLGEAYNPSCLIKVARLYAQGMTSQTLLEEIQYSNVLTQTLNQIKNDFETLASESILTMSNTGMLLNGAVSANTSSFFGNDETPNFDQSVQVNIKLKDIFGLGQSENFWLSTVNGVVVELELENVKPLINQSCVTNLIEALPREVVYDASNNVTKGYTHDYSTNPYSTRCQGQNLYAPSSNEMASLLTSSTDASGVLHYASKISCPQSYRYDSSYIDYCFPPPSTVDTAALIPGTWYRIIDVDVSGTPNAAQWQTAGCLPLAPATPVLPVVGQHFRCIAVTATGGTCIPVNAANKIVGIPGSNSETITINPSIKWTTANMLSLQITTDTLLKLVFKISQAGHLDRFFEYMSLVGSVTAWTSAAVGAVITLKDSFVYPKFQGTYLQGATIELDSFEVIPNSEQFAFPSSDYESLVDNNLITEVSVAIVNKLQIGGVLSGGTLAQVTSGKIRQLTGGNVFFNLGCSLTNQIASGSNNAVFIYPDEYDSPDINSMRRLYSNQTKKLPVQTGLVKITKAVKNANGTTWDLHFQTMGLENNNSLQNKCLISPGTYPNIEAGLGKRTDASGFDLTMFNTKIPNLVLPAQLMVPGEWYGITAVGTDSTGNIDTDWSDAGNDAGLTPAVGQSFQCIKPISESAVGATVIWLQPNRSDLTYVPKSYQITKAELVLVQTEKDPSMPPSPIYSTYKCEAVTVDSSYLSEWNRQFVILEPNCYNALLCAPYYTDENFETLISKSRGINQYRWSLNNIDNTNRNIAVRDNISWYPASLHLDKLMDCMKNNIGSLKSYSGINGVSRSVDPPVVFPLKIYTAVDAENHYLNPLSGYTLQFAGYSDPVHNQFIHMGPVFLFKQCFRTL